MHPGARAPFHRTARPPLPLPVRLKKGFAPLSAPPGDAAAAFPAQPEGYLNES